MSSFEITTNAGTLGSKLRRLPVLIEKHITPALDLSGKEINNAARSNVRKNKSFGNSHLMNSILNKTSVDGLEVIIGAGMNYAAFVEFGTRRGGKPNQQTMIDWLRVKGIKPNNPDMSEKELAYVVARDIAKNGTKAAPFMQPAFNSEKAATIERINTAIQRAIQEIH